MYDEKLSIEKLRPGLLSANQSTRMSAAMAAGTYPNDNFIEILIERCAVEPDFFVRDTLSWALIRQDRELVFQRLIRELYSTTPQAVSQALHTFTKLDNPKAWPLITKEFIVNEDLRIARTAWRAASRFVPEAEKSELGELLVTQLGRGDSEVQLALSKAILALDLKRIPTLTKACQSKDEIISVHAEFTLKLKKNPELERALSVEFAKRIDGLKGAAEI